MRLTKVRLKNVCQHRDLNVTFKPGLNAILGFNGCGKSNLVNSIYAGFTNDFSRFKGKKEEQISQFAGEDDDSYIEVYADHGPSSLYIRRGLNPASKQLIVNGDEKITSEKAIAVKLEDILGVSSSILSTYVFVDQWQLFSFLTEIPSARAKSLQKLFKTDRAELCHKLLGDYLSKLQIPMVAINKDTIRTRLKDNLARRQKLSKKVKAYLVNQEVYEEEERLNTEYAMKYDSRRTHERRLESLRARIGSKAREKGIVEEKLAALREDIDEIQQSLVKGKEEHEAAKQALSAFEANEPIRQQRAQILRNLQDYDEAFSKIPAPQKPTNYVSKNERPYIAEQIDECSHEIKKLETYIKTFKDGAVECPTCGTPAGDLIAPAVFEELLPGMRKNVAELRAALRDSDTYDTDFTYYGNKLADQEYYHAMAEQQLARLPNDQIHDIDPSSVANLLMVYEELKTELDNLIGDEKQLSQAHASLIGELKALTEESEEVKALIHELHSYTKDGAIACEKKNVELKAMWTEHWNAKAELDATEQFIRADEQALDELAKIDERAVRTRSLVDLFNAVRNIFHHEALPKLAAQNYLEELTSEINDTLLSLDSPFQVESSDNLSFRALFHDGRNVPAEALSGGEKAVFAIAFRIVVNSTFAGDLGLLCLDEPTAGMDKKNIKCLSTAFERLKVLSNSTGLQCVVITHEEALMPFFDNVISL